MRLFLFWTITILAILNFSFCQMSYSTEIDGDENNQRDIDFVLVKRPSWTVGKRIIEFKKHSASHQGGGELYSLLRKIGQSYHKNAIKNRKI